MQNTMEMSSSRLIVLASVFLVAFANITFFDHVTDVYPLTSGNFLYLSSLTLLLTAFTAFLLSLAAFGRLVKPLLIVVLIVSAFTGYFMDTYNVVIDDAMIDNALNTDAAESLDLLSLKLLLYVLLLGLLPSWLVYKVKIKDGKLRNALLSRAKLIALSVAVIVAMLVLFGKFYASFIREHKELRYYANPSYYIYSVGKYMGRHMDSGEQPLVAIGEDAAIPEEDMHRELVIMVVGETARADRFSLNGYARKTNPLLEQKGVISFSNVSSCGTSTAVSVPCMFSIYGRSDFDASKAHSTENVLDVIHHAGANVLWLDNNSDSKGVAERLPYQSYKTPQTNPNCDVECRDEGMFAHLQSYIDEHPQGDIVVVLHQMGSHGPAYYKRYPKAFERFTPVCETNQLETCSNEAIGNTYDNTILYTDYFLSRVIELLERNSGMFEAAMFYISDHGESLGEGGHYLHGMPYFLAPEEQTHVPMILWFSDSFEKDEVNIDILRQQVDREYSHDNIFHTLLGVVEIKSEVYRPSMDLIKRTNEHAYR